MSDMDDLIKDMKEKMKDMRDKTFGVSAQITLGELVLKLESIKEKTKNVSLDFGDFYPTDFDSWRGSYCEIALNYDDGWPREEEVTVDTLLKKAKESIGQTFEGYKGGQFTMNKDTPVWVANYSKSGNTGLVGVIETEYCVILTTAYCDF